jgi:hypothetical protein
MMLRQVYSWNYKYVTIGLRVLCLGVLPISTFFQALDLFHYLKMTVDIWSVSIPRNEKPETLD